MQKHINKIVFKRFTLSLNLFIYKCTHIYVRIYISFIYVYIFYIYIRIFIFNFYFKIKNYLKIPIKCLQHFP